MKLQVRSWKIVLPQCLQAKSWMLVHPWIKTSLTNTGGALLEDTQGDALD